MAARSAFDLTITYEDIRVDLMIRRPQNAVGSRQARPVQGVSQPIRGGEAFATQEALSTYADCSGGAGWGERLAENIYHYDLPGDSTVPGLVMPPGRLTEVSLTALGVTGPIRAAFEASEHLYLIAPGHALKLANGTGAPIVDQNLTFFGDFAAYSAQTFGGHGYVGGQGLLWKLDGSTLNWSQSSDVYAQFLSNVYWVRQNAGSQKFVASTWTGGPYTFPDRSIVYTDGDPMVEANYSEEITIGNLDYSIVGLIAANQHLYVNKTNGLHDLDDRLYSPNITHHRQNQHEPGDRKALALHNGNIFIGWRQGMDMVSLEQEGVRQDRPRQCEFGAGLPNYGPIRGEPTALHSYRGLLWEAYYNETADTSYITVANRYEDWGVPHPGRGGPLLHHGALAVLPGIRVELLYSTQPAGAARAPRLWIGGEYTASGAASLHWLSQPVAGTPIQDLHDGGPMQFADEWTKVWPRDNGGSDATRKDLTHVSVRGDNLGQATLDTYVAFDGGDFLSDSLGQATSVYETFGVNEPTAARDLTFKTIGRGTTTVPAIFKSLESRYGVSVESNDLFVYPIEFGYGVKHHDGEFRGDPFAIEEALKNLQGKRVELTDNQRQQTYTARMLQGARIDWEEYPSGERTGRATGSISFVILDSVWRLDSGHALDSGRRLG